MNCDDENKFMNKGQSILSFPKRCHLLVYRSYAWRSSEFNLEFGSEFEKYLQCARHVVAIDGLSIHYILLCVSILWTFIRHINDEFYSIIMIVGLLSLSSRLLCVFIYCVRTGRRLVARSRSVCLMNEILSLSAPDRNVRVWPDVGLIGMCALHCVAG